MKDLRKDQPNAKSVTNTLGEGEKQQNVKKRIVRVQFDIEYNGISTPIDGSSETVPDMHMTVRQLLENHSRGIDGTTQVRQPLYFGTEIPMLDDITDVQKFKESLERRLESVKEWIKNNPPEKTEEQNDKPQIDVEAHKAEHGKYPEPELPFPEKE